MVDKSLYSVDKMNNFKDFLNFQTRIDPNKTMEDIINEGTSFKAEKYTKAPHVYEMDYKKAEKGTNLRRNEKKKLTEKKRYRVQPNMFEDIHSFKGKEDKLLLKLERDVNEIMNERNFEGVSDGLRKLLPKETMINKIEKLKKKNKLIDFILVNF